MLAERTRSKIFEPPEPSRSCSPPSAAVVPPWVRQHSVGTGSQDIEQNKSEVMSSRNHFMKADAGDITYTSKRGVGQFSPRNPEHSPPETTKQQCWQSLSMYDTTNADYTFRKARHRSSSSQQDDQNSVDAAGDGGRVMRKAESWRCFSQFVQHDSFAYTWKRGQGSCSPRASRRRAAERPEGAAGICSGGGERTVDWSSRPVPEVMSARGLHLRRDVSANEDSTTDMPPAGDYRHVADRSCKPLGSDCPRAATPVTSPVHGATDKVGLEANGRTLSSASTAGSTPRELSSQNTGNPNGKHEVCRWNSAPDGGAQWLQKSSQPRKLDGRYVGQPRPLSAAGSTSALKAPAGLSSRPGAGSNRAERPRESPASSPRSGTPQASPRASPSPLKTVRRTRHAEEAHVTRMRAPPYFSSKQGPRRSNAQRGEVES